MMVKELIVIVIMVDSGGEGGGGGDNGGGSSDHNYNDESGNVIMIDCSGWHRRWLPEVVGGDGGGLTMVMVIVMAEMISGDG